MIVCWHTQITHFVIGNRSGMLWFLGTHCGAQVAVPGFIVQEEADAIILVPKIVKRQIQRSDSFTFGLAHTFGNHGLVKRRAFFATVCILFDKSKATCNRQAVIKLMRIRHPARRKG